LKALNIGKPTHVDSSACVMNLDVIVINANTSLWRLLMELLGYSFI
jgi:hypothetical protein